MISGVGNLQMIEILKSNDFIDDLFLVIATLVLTHQVYSPLIEVPNFDPPFWAEFYVYSGYIEVLHRVCRQTYNWAPQCVVG